jgi:hypothetical protein
MVQADHHLRFFLVLRLQLSLGFIELCHQTIALGKRGGNWERP